MSSNGASNSRPVAADVDSSLEKIKRRLTSVSDGILLQGPLLVRSHTLRKWNERWVILDPTTGRMEYKVGRNDPTARGIVELDDSSTVALSHVNLHGLPKYHGCCFYLGTPSRKHHIFVAETSAAARAWVSTLQATVSVLKAHKEAVSASNGSGSTKMGTLAAAISAANSTAAECSKEIEAAMQVSVRNSRGLTSYMDAESLNMDDFTIMMETLRVKDEELQNLAHDIRARNSTINDLAGMLTDTAEAAESAASTVDTINQQRKMAFSEVEKLAQMYGKQLESLKLKLKELEDKASALDREKEDLIKQRDDALREAELSRSGLAKEREHVSALEAAISQENEKVRVAEAIARARGKDAEQTESDSVKDKHEFLAYVDGLQAELQSYDSPVTQVKSSDDSGDKECLSISNISMVPKDSLVHRSVDQTGIRLAEGDTAEPVIQTFNGDDDDDERRVGFTSLKDLDTDKPM